VDPTKVETVLQWERQKLVTKICSFLGLTGYYIRFIKGFSKIVMPLTQFTKNGQTFVWTKKCDNGFQELKKRLTTSLILALPYPTRYSMIFCDASKMGLRCVPMQDRRVVVYASRQLRAHEKMGLRYGNIMSMVVSSKFLVIIRVSDIYLIKIS